MSKSPNWLRFFFPFSFSNQGPNKVQIISQLKVCCFTSPAACQWFFSLFLPCRSMNLTTSIWSPCSPSSEGSWWEVSFAPESSCTPLPLYSSHKSAWNLYQIQRAIEQMINWALSSFYKWRKKMNKFQRLNEKNRCVLSAINTARDVSSIRRSFKKCSMPSICSAAGSSRPWLLITSRI